jgi:PAS domain S-box-containing protein
MKKTVLIVDDDADLRNNLEDILGDEGYVTLDAGSCSEALDIVKMQQPEVALLDIKLPDGTGTNLLSEIKRYDPECLCTIMTAYADLDSSLAALKQGAYHYLQKPIRPMELITLLTRAFETVRLRKEKVDAEENLRESEEKYRTLFERTANPILFMDERGYYIDGNEAALRFLECDRDTLLRMNVEDTLAPGKERTILRRDQPLWVSGGVAETEYLVHGSTKTLELTLTPLKLRDRAVVVGVGRDITDRRQSEIERKLLENQLIQAQKMEAVGTLAGGISHDFNNLLQGILGYTQILLIDRNPDDADYARLKEVERAALRASELTQQLLTFSRKVESKVRPVDLNQQVREIHRILERTIPKMIDIEMSLHEDLYTINADPAQLEQIVMNLCLNARDAMPDGGRLVLETRNATLNESYCKRHMDCLPGEYVLLSISDNGCGMDAETLQRVFEPFYTTKRIGKGTGLGLSMVYGIIKSHRGHVVCKSEPGEGTRFEIYFPVIRPGTVESPEEEEVRLPDGGSETLLVVDDEEPLLNLVEHMLSRFGYRVLKATSGEQAVKLFKQHQDTISLVVLDLIMPGIGGLACLEALLRMDPGVKVLIASGYLSQEQVEKSMSKGAIDVIRKPYEWHRMLNVIREALDG